MRTPEALRELDRAMAAIRAPTVPLVRTMRRTISARLRTESRADVLALALSLVARDDGFDRFIAYELVAAHRPTMERITAREVNALGKGMDSWDDVDAFASFVSGPAWRESRISDRDIAAWAASKDLWQRRAAVVSTVPLNNRTRGGSGDYRRTLAVCELLLDDREPMIVKAVSGALRELSKRDPDAVRKFIRANEPRLASLVRREVHSKLSTGLKNPRSRKKFK
jgi:3-methyladenine DNA glycosylase AlkD